MSSTLDTNNSYDPHESDMTSSNYSIAWTGWKTAYDNPYLIGQYLAFPLTNTENDRPDRFLYSSTSGAAGRFRKGDTFDISMHEGVYLTTIDASQTLLYISRMEALKRLVDLIQSIQAASTATNQMPILPTSTGGFTNVSVNGLSTTGSGLTIGSGIQMPFVYISESSRTELEHQLLTAVEKFGLKHKGDCPFEKCACGVDAIMDLVKKELHPPPSTE